MSVTIFDYGAGNMHSLAKALDDGSSCVHVETDPLAAVNCDVLVLPGVGAFGYAAERLAPGRDCWRRFAVGLPCVGICLGMQLLFDESDEGPGAGLGVIPGRVTRLRARRVPHIGWNSIEDTTTALRARTARRRVLCQQLCLPPNDADVVRAWTRHEDDRFPAVVRAGNAVGVQFHPEKSSRPGVAFLRALVEEA